MATLKLQFPVWASADAAAVHGALMSLAPGLRQRGWVLAAQANLADEAVAPAADKRMSTVAPLPDALLSLWLDGEREAEVAAEVQAALAGLAVVSVYRVEEAEPLPDSTRRMADGDRTPGFSQVAFLQCPDFLDYQQWLSYWKTVHTPLAIDTQSTFRYVQNRVLAVLAEGTGATRAKPLAAIVEECFPAEAMTDAEVFYDAKGDPARFQHNANRMMESCAKFIDFSQIDVLPTSEYRWS